MRPRRVALHIDTLVVHGLEGIDRTALAEALQAALTPRLLAMSRFDGASASRAGAAIAVPAHVTAPQLGTALAEAIGDLLQGADRRAGPAANGGPRHG